MEVDPPAGGLAAGGLKRTASVRSPGLATITGPPEKAAAAMVVLPPARTEADLTASRDTLDALARSRVRSASALEQMRARQRVQMQQALD